MLITGIPPSEARQLTMRERKACIAVVNETARRNKRGK